MSCFKFGFTRTAVVVSLVVLAACSDDSSPTQTTPNKLPPTESRVIPPPALSTMLASSPALQVCGTPVELNLTDGKYTPGKVTISNDAQNIYIVYDAPGDGWYISDTRLAVFRQASSIPRDANGQPNPWAFPIAGEHEPPQKSITHTVSLASLGVTAGQTVAVSAMAGAVHPTNQADWNQPWEWLVLWGVPAGSTNAIYTYTVAACAGQVPPPPPPSTGGVITITFDDGWLTTYTRAYPVLKEFGLVGNVAIYPQAIDGQWTGFMTLSQIRELNSNGWSVVSHSWSHRDLRTLSATDLQKELVDSKAWIERNGFGTSKVFIVPFHSWGDRERTAIKQHYSFARGYTVDQFWPERFEKYPPASPYDLTGFEPEYAPFTTAEGRAATMRYVQRAVDEGEYLDLFFHQITAEQLPAFRELMRQVAAYKANVRTFTQAF